jgi:hypothetical protein
VTSVVRLDHLIVAAASLAQGVAWCEATLGVTPGPGGKHVQFGTHNQLLKIATPAFPEVYLEIIAVDPEAPAPARPRWFGLDAAELQADLAGRGPRLVHVVARSQMLDMHRFGLIHMGLQPGEPVAAWRDTPQGRLSWQILVRPDGRLLCGGALPTLIQWQGRHPAASMPDSGVTLKALTLRGISDRAATLLRLHGVTSFPAGSPALTATLATPKGEVTLDSMVG